MHPSLLPAFAGGMDLQVHEAVLKAGVKVTGARFPISRFGSLENKRACCLGTVQVARFTLWTKALTVGQSSRRNTAWCALRCESLVQRFVFLHRKQVERLDTPESLKAKVQPLEGLAFIEAIRDFSAGLPLVATPNLPATSAGGGSSKL